jgi:hypothetical protein
MKIKWASLNESLEVQYFKHGKTLGWKHSLKNSSIDQVYSKKITSSSTFNTTKAYN